MNLQTQKQNLESLITVDKDILKEWDEKMKTERLSAADIRTLKYDFNNYIQDCMKLRHINELIDLWEG